MLLRCVEVLFESNAVSGLLHARVMVQIKSGICAGVDVDGVWDHWSPGGCFFTGVLKAECGGHSLWLGTQNYPPCTW